ncbi:hypothetical protein MS3_00010520 [Schistosoma haematobium]|uniref:Uncharacterized protein n=1 Tax=Schistosoma haematobium TaxID=6185 RepID=A0A922LT75_SCHHA|nr:hypothetical protein MS3_00010520 [Schistosoma haematobium]KAH9592872.1 hypothetical protein MS3_00010520 [Schistosoma haematobium]
MMLTFLWSYYQGSAVLPDVNNDINDTFGQDESEHEITKTPLGINTSDDDKKFVLEPIFVVNQTIEHHDNKTVKLDKEEFNRSAYKIENESVDNNDNNIIINININKSGGHNGDEKNNHTKYYTYYHGPRRLRDKAMAS